MGFSLTFMRIKQDEQVDADRGGVADFLERRGLQLVAGRYGGEIFDLDGKPLSFDDRFSDLYLDPLDKSDPLSGGIFHASLTGAECEFIYELCVAAGFMIVNPSGDPTFLVPQRNHAPEDLPELDDVAWVESAAELLQALTGSFDEFRAYRNKVLSQYPDPGRKRL
ncbi:hypothetical protein [Rhodococcus globerulus]|jgi:hypothetical protein|uniref:Uncharacterized protein n=1 Tax=Rhodococcus globerulus TaxID=33008 RepID=A0ABU4BWV5_RHOGO|nr:hypothetical protein [Rhodococcus globerulus]MDV6268715.1 hypothetical protein [Rhodococcus globerulus]